MPRDSLRRRRRSVVICFDAGRVGLVAFLRVATGKLEASVSMPSVDTSMIIVTTLGAIAFFREAATLAGVALLRPVE